MCGICKARDFIERSRDPVVSQGVESEENKILWAELTTEDVRIIDEYLDTVQKVETHYGDEIFICDGKVIFYRCQSKCPCFISGLDYMHEECRNVLQQIIERQQDEAVEMQHVREFLEWEYEQQKEEEVKEMLIIAHEMHGGWKE
ncbi:hypothetical protein FOCC_FOCC016802, partial [Frankliniella occidentalis]